MRTAFLKTAMGIVSRIRQSLLQLERKNRWLASRDFSQGGLAKSRHLRHN